MKRCPRTWRVKVGRQDGHTVQRSFVHVFGRWLVPSVRGLPNVLQQSAQLMYISRGWCANCGQVSTRPNINTETCVAHCPTQRILQETRSTIICGTALTFPMSGRFSAARYFARFTGSKGSPSELFNLAASSVEVRASVRASVRAA